MVRLSYFFLIVLLLGSACGRIKFAKSPAVAGDGGSVDAAREAAVDGDSAVLRLDAAVDGASDSGFDASVDAGGDATADAGLDAAVSFPVTVSAGFRHTCATDADGVAFCWGSDQFFQLGEDADGNDDDEVVPVRVNVSALPSGARFTSLSGEFAHTCGAASDGNIYCWGFNTSGRIGVGGNAPIPRQMDRTPLAPGEQFVSASIGGNNGCGLTNDGNIYCWGDDNTGELGNGLPLEDSPIPERVDRSTLLPTEEFTLLDTGSNHSCGLTNIGSAYCWGSDRFLQLGENADGDDDDEPIPVKVDTSAFEPGATFTSISTAVTHSCAVSSAGSAYCWGITNLGSEGGRTDIPRRIDQSALLVGERFVTVTTGGNHSCALTDLDNIYCWGNDSDGRLGDGPVDQPGSAAVRVDRTALEPDEIFLTVSAGGSHSCATTDKERIYCWGSDADGQLGEDADADNLDETSPVRVEGFGP